MARILVFSQLGFGGTSKEYRVTDPDLVVNGDEFTFESAIVLAGQLTLYDATGFTGNSITLSASNGPEGDGAYKDFVDFTSTGPFTVRSIQS